MKQDYLVTYAILITRGRAKFKGEEEGDSPIWDHEEPVTISEHEKWYREDGEYREECEFIKEHLFDVFEREAHIAMSSGNATVISNVLKTKCKHRGYTTDDSSSLDVGDVWVGFEKDRK